MPGGGASASAPDELRRCSCLVQSRGGGDQHERTARTPALAVSRRGQRLDLEVGRLLGKRRPQVEAPKVTLKPEAQPDDRIAAKAIELGTNVTPQRASRRQALSEQSNRSKTRQIG